MEERRAEDKRIEEIQNTVKSIHDILQGEKGICVRTSVLEQQTKSIQAELTEHKTSHWTMYGLLVALGGAILGFIEYIKK